MNLNALLCPRSVAIIGASADTAKLSGMILNFLSRSGYKGKVYPVNPKYDRIGEFECFPSVEALPCIVDLMVCVVPASIAVEAVEAAARRGVPYCLLMTGGFGEGRSGDEGRSRLARLKSLCEETGMHIVGPNTVGMVNFRQHLPLTFADWYGRDTGLRGGVAIVTHSGSVGGLIFSALQLNRIGVDYWVGLGNEATLETADFISYFSDDPDVHTVICYMEGVVSGRKFLAACDKARRRGTRIVVLNAGQFPETVRSTVAHTAKSPSFREVYKGVFKQYGVIQAASLSELNDVMALLTSLGSQAGARIGVISASGGACSVIADHIIQAGLMLPELPAPLQSVLDEAIPIYGSSSNPIDLSADVVARGEILQQTLDALQSDDSIDVWMVFGRPVIDRYYEKLISFVKTTGKAVIACSGVPLANEVHDALRNGGIAVLPDPELCLRALARIANARANDDSIREHPVPKYIIEDRETAATRPCTMAHFSNQGISVSSHAQPFLRVETQNDADFGAVLAVSWQPSCGVGYDKIVRALPVQEHDLYAIAADLQRQGTDRPLSAAQVYDAMRALSPITEEHSGQETLSVDFGRLKGRLVVCSPMSEVKVP